MEKQKKITPSFARGTKNLPTNYTYGIQYKTSDYTFKIYHKGTDFEMNDKKRLLQGRDNRYDLEYIQEQADRILRYEVTYRTGKFKYFFKMLIFPFDIENSPNNFLFNPHYVFLSKVFSLLPKTTDLMTSLRNKKLRYEFYTQFSKFALNFTLISPFDITNDLELLKNSYSVTFDKDLFSCLFSFFWDKVNQYQVSSIDSTHLIAQKIKDYQSKKTYKRKVLNKDHSPHFLKLFLPALLSQYVNLKELQKYIPDSTYYGLKAQLKDIGIDTFTESKETTVESPKLDYSQYFIYFSRYF